MTAMLFCEGSERDKQIAQESSGHKDGRTGAGMPCRRTTEALPKKRRQKSIDSIIPDLHHQIAHLYIKVYPTKHSPNPTDLKS